MIPISRTAKSAGRALVGTMLAGVLLAGCAVGPNYKRPPITSPAQFRGQENSANAAPAGSTSGALPSPATRAVPTPPEAATTPEAAAAPKGAPAPEAAIEPPVEADAPAVSPHNRSQLTIASLIGLVAGVAGMVGLGWWRRQERRHYAGGK